MTYGKAQGVLIENCKYVMLPIYYVRPTVISANYCWYTRVVSRRNCINNARVPHEPPPPSQRNRGSVLRPSPSSRSRVREPRST